MGDRRQASPDDINATAAMGSEGVSPNGGRTRGVTRVFFLGPCFRTIPFLPLLPSEVDPASLHPYCIVSTYSVYLPTRLLEAKLYSPLVAPCLLNHLLYGSTSPSARPTHSFTSLQRSRRGRRYWFFVLDLCIRGRDLATRSQRRSPFPRGRFTISRSGGLLLLRLQIPSPISPGSRFSFRKPGNRYGSHERPILWWSAQAGPSCAARHHGSARSCRITK